MERGEFERLVEEHYPSFYRVAYRMVHNHADAEEVVQDAFLKAWTRRDQFRHESTFKTWMYRIVINTAISLQRKHTRHRRKLSSLFFESQTRMKASGNQMENNYMLVQMSEQLNEALQRIPESSRSLIVLRDIEGLSYEDIAVILGVPVGTVKSRIWRARHQLKQELNHLLKLWNESVQTPEKTEEKRGNKTTTPGKQQSRGSIL